MHTHADKPKTSHTTQSADSVREQAPVQKKENNTGLPDALKSGIENLSGYSMEDVKVHYNSHQPAQLQAHAYAQGTDIHLAPGQERHLPHEAWHVVQQKQGRVKPTVQLKGHAPINDDAGLEQEADRMGSVASNWSGETVQQKQDSGSGENTIQRMVAYGPFPTVYAPREIRKIADTDNYTQAKYIAGLRLILGGNPVLGTGEPLVRLLGQYAADDAAARSTVMDQFRDTHYIYRYNNPHVFATATPSGKHAVMEPRDMGDTTAQVPDRYVDREACVIQALRSIGAQVPGTGAVGTNQQHHAYSLNQGLDYRTDSDYLQLYIGRYGLRLVHSGLTPWGNVNWPTLGAGNYVMTSYAAQPGANTVGHMVAVRVNAQFVPEVMDQQGLTKPTLDAGNGFIKYIFRVP